MSSRYLPRGESDGAAVAVAGGGASTGGPPRERHRQPRHRAVGAKPARVVDRGAGRRTSAADVLDQQQRGVPPESMRATWATAPGRAPTGRPRCAAARWFTAYGSLPGASAARPSRRTRPRAARQAGQGPAVTAILSTSASATPAVASARSTVVTIASGRMPGFGDARAPRRRTGDVLGRAGRDRVGQQFRQPRTRPTARLVARHLDPQDQRLRRFTRACPGTAAAGLASFLARRRFEIVRRITRASVPEELVVRAPDAYAQRPATHGYKN